ncbi:hypothetical protein ACFWN7_11815 [Agromyces sp. NPDC058484]|uniref:hypothetical protein n=1 Tax=Agromyces sp. NPDC058484 TaxID=3346524 RepID=UPI00365FF968
MTRFATAGLWLIPVYGALLALGTITHQPSYDTDFQSYAEYITTDQFLVSHLGASIAGAALGQLGIVAVLAFLVRGRTAVPATLGAASFIIGSVFLVAVFGVAAFAQPAIGRAYLADRPGIHQVNEDVYGLPLVVTAGIGLLLFLIGGIVLGIAIAREGRSLKWVGIGFAGSLVVFVLGFLMLEIAQPIGAAVFALVGIALAIRLPQHARRAEAAAPPAAPRPRAV